MLLLLNLLPEEAMATGPRWPLLAALWFWSVPTIGSVACGPAAAVVYPPPLLLFLEVEKPPFIFMLESVLCC